MEQTPIQKKPVGQQISGIPDAVVHALLAEAGLLRKKYQRKNSKSSCRKSKGSEKPTKPQPAPEDELEKRVAGLFDDGATNADQRLREFLRGERTLTEKDGTESYYDPAEGRTYTLEEVGTVMGVTRERVRQIEEVALRKMWRLIRSINMREELTEDDWINGLSGQGGGERDATVYMPDPV